jgi:hypothetical protein
MNPVDFPQANRTFTKPTSMTDEECAPLRVHDTGGELVSCWQPTEEERAAIAAGAPVWLRIFGRGHPPVVLEVAPPFSVSDAATAPPPATEGEQLHADLAQLRAAARRMLDVSKLGVSEDEGLRRARALARLVGYAHDPNERSAGIPLDPAAASREAYRLAQALTEEVEVEGSAWGFALFLFREAQPGEAMGQVIQISRDRERTLFNVARWVKDVLEAKGFGRKGAQG